LTYAHLLVDEVQDLSVVELAVLLRCAAREGSVTLAGDPAQRMVFDTGYRGWEDLLTALGLDTVSIAPLQIGYRSTAEIQRFAQAVLGPQWSENAPAASRVGVPVEAFHFGDPGEAVVFLADALRELSHQEPLASVALIARYPAQAETYYQALRKAEVPGLRRVVEQDFSFAPGIEVTDVRQVKGLEFDYVLLLDVNAESYPDTTESRHLLHIAATRAAHQLWLIVPGQPSRVLQALAAK
jgi:DNA helicase-2/ATP-dependent DNA helicase PcrA